MRSDDCIDYDSHTYVFISVQGHKTLGNSRCTHEDLNSIYLHIYRNEMTIICNLLVISLFYIIQH